MPSGAASCSLSKTDGNGASGRLYARISDPGTGQPKGATRPRKSVRASPASAALGIVRSQSVASAPATDASNTSVSGHARPVPAPSTPRSALLHRRCRRRPLLDVIGQAPLLSGDDNVTAIAPPPGYGYHS